MKVFDKLKSKVSSSNKDRGGKDGGHDKGKNGISDFAKN